jgi:hypothetical protein
MSHSRDQSQKENRKASISKSFHEDANYTYFFRSLLKETIVRFSLLPPQRFGGSSQP